MSQNLILPDNAYKQLLQISTILMVLVATLQIINLIEQRQERKAEKELAAK